jgi:hypothetical protein
MARRWFALAGAVIVVCVAVGGTVGVMRAFADEGSGGAPPVERGSAPAAAKVKQTPTTKLLATWVHTGSGTAPVGGYAALDSPITVICKKAPCLLVVDKTIYGFVGASTTQIAPCVTHDLATGGGGCSWLGVSTGWPATTNFGASQSEPVELSQGAHSVNVGTYVQGSAMTIESYTFVYRLYQE